ncbi:hypothetical protein BHE74_00032853 [Ensete ventricosum]|nr:hypothetical protein GW17_00014533 [Ensete ventricosum]RWW60168.1 hypothetical protein BHE74_00032853 [Ensete ventricosum]
MLHKLVKLFKSLAVTHFPHLQSRQNMGKLEEEEGMKPMLMGRRMSAHQPIRMTSRLRIHITRPKCCMSMRISMTEMELQGEGEVGAEEGEDEGVASLITIAAVEGIRLALHLLAM